MLCGLVPYRSVSCENSPLTADMPILGAYACLGEDLRLAWQRYEAGRRDFYARHDLRPVAELLADAVAMADVPWDPATDPP